MFFTFEPAHACLPSRSASTIVAVTDKIRSPQRFPGKSLILSEMMCEQRTSSWIQGVYYLSQGSPLAFRRRDRIFFWILQP
jgi:hypothetical protein